MRVRDVLVADVGEADARAWRTLSDSAMEPNPFADPRFLVPSVAHHEAARGSRVLLVDDEGELRGALPYSAATRAVSRLRIPILSTSETFSAHEGERFHPLVSPRDPEATMLALIDHARTHSRAGLLELSRIPRGGPLEDALLSAARQRRLPVIVDDEREFVCALSSTVDAPDADPLVAWEHLSTRTRKKYRRLLGNMAVAAGGDLRVVDESDDPSAIQRYLDLQARGWKGDPTKDGKAFRRTGLDEWFTAVTDAFREDDRLTVLSLRSDHAVVYSTVVLHAGRTAFGFHDAYADEFGSFSPGAIGRLAELRATLAQPQVDVYDPSMDDRKYPAALSLYPDSRAFASYTIALRPGAGFVVRALPLARRIRDGLRRSAS